MASDEETLRHEIAREIADELENRGFMVTVQEAAAIMDASRPDPGARCTKCGSRVAPAARKCNNCGSTQAISSDTPLACKNCGAPIGDAEWPTCVRCGSSQARIVRQDPAAPFECK